MLPICFDRADNAQLIPAPMPSRSVFSASPAHVAGYPVSTASGAGDRRYSFRRSHENGDGSDFSASGGRLRNHSAARVASPVWHIHCPLWLSLLRRRSYRTSAGCGTVLLRRNRRQFRIVQRINQRMKMLATTLHGAQQFNGFSGETSGEVVSPFARQRSERNRRFNIAASSTAGRNAVDQQV